MKWDKTDVDTERKIGRSTLFDGFNKLHAQMPVLGQIAGPYLK